MTDRYAVIGNPIRNSKSPESHRAFPRDRSIRRWVGMLVEQAAEAFAWWRDVRPETRAIIAALTVPLV